MNILLINSPNEIDNSLENANYSLFPHIGIVQLATRLVLGNDHAIFFPKEILTNRPSIDYIITNDIAEQAFSNLVSCIIDETSVQEVDSLAYRHHGDVLINPVKKYSLKDRNTVPDLNFIKNDLDKYSKKYYSQHGHLHGNEVNVITINNARGCENKLRCSYCSIADLRVTTGDPVQFWETVAHYHDKYNINLFF